MNGMQHGGTRNTGWQFGSRIPLQLGNGDHEYNNRAAGGAAAVEAVEDGDEDDDLEKLEAEMAIAKKAAWKKTAEEKAEKEEAAARAPIEKAKKLLA